MTTFVVDHYGFVTHSIPEASAMWCNLLGFVLDGPEYVDPEQRVRIQFLCRDGLSDFRIELLVPSDAKSPVMKLARAGGGFHHVCVRVATLDGFAEELARTPFVPVRAPTPAPAFGGRRVAFVYLAGLGLIEFVESAGAPPLAEFADSSFAALRASFPTFLAASRH